MRRADLRQTLWEAHLRVLSQELGAQVQVLRGPQMGVQIRRGRIWRFWGAPIFRPEVPKPCERRDLRTSGLKIGAPEKRQILPRRI